MGLKVLFARCLNSRRGNIAIITAIAMLPIALMAGGVIDIDQWVSCKSSSQTALDSAALYAAASESSDPTALKASAVKIYNQNIIGTSAAQSAIQSLSYNSTNRQIILTAGGVYVPIFAQIVGLSQFPYAVSSQTLQQTAGTLEVALVLDNTYSMTSALGSGTRLSVLKTAASGLISTIMTTQNAGFVKVGVVPYADYVNVGLTNRGQTWLTVPADYSTSATSTSTPSCTKSTTTCVNQVTTTCTSTTNHDGVITTTTSSCKTGGTCTTTSTQLSPCPSPVTTTTTTNYKWWGCVFNQVQSAALAMPDPTTPYTGWMETNGQHCLNAITPLTSSSTVATAAVNALVDSISANSYYPETYIPAGLHWGINVLSPAAPFTDGAAYDPKNKVPRKALVLMTDGFNTEYLQTTGTSAGQLAGSSATITAAQQAKAYADEQAMCNYAKLQKIEIYTIGVGVTDATSLSNLQTCATDISHYFDVQSDTGLIAAFNAIAGSLQNLRIAG